MPRFLHTAAVSVCALLLFCTAVSGQDETTRTKPVEGLRSNPPGLVALTGATLVVEPGRTVTDQAILIREGKIEGLVAADAIPTEAKRIDMKGKMIYPGIVEPFYETDSSITVDPGLPYWNSQINPQRKMKDGLVLDDAALDKLRRAGIATIAAVPKDRIVKGTSCVISTANGALSDRLLNPQWAQHVRLTVAGIRSEGYPNSPMGAVALARQAFLDAQWYHQAWQAYQHDPSLQQPEVCDALQVLSEQVRAGDTFVFDGLNELFVLRADDFAREFGLNYMVRGSGREYLRLESIAKVNRPLLIPVNFPRAPNVSTAEAAMQTELDTLMHWELAPENPGRVHKAGVTFAFTLNGLREPSDYLAKLREAIQRGLPGDEALRALTITPANLLGVSDVVGTIAKGKWANLIVADKELWDESAKIDETWVQGQRFAWNTVPEDSLDGTWQLDAQVADGSPSPLWLSLKDTTTKASGTIRKVRDLPKEETAKPEEKAKEEGKSSEGSAAESKEPASGESRAAEPATGTPPTPEATAASTEPSPSDRNAEADEKVAKKDAAPPPKVEAQLEGLTIKDGQLTARFSSDVLVEKMEGVTQLSLTVLPASDGKRLIGRLLWADGKVTTITGKLDPALSTPSSNDKDDASAKGREGAEAKDAAGKDPAAKEAPAKDETNKDPASNEPAKVTDGEKPGDKPQRKSKKEVLATIHSTVNYPLGTVGISVAPEQVSRVVFRKATVWTCGPAGTLKETDVLVENGKIVAIGAALVVPENTQVIEAAGMHLSPGIIDCHSHMATDGGVNESGQAITAEVRIGDFIDSDDITIYRQLAGGVTSANILHGSANPIGGQNQVIKLRWGALPEEMKMAEAPAGIKFALGENVKRSNFSGMGIPARYPTTRMGVEQILRDQFAAAAEYEKSWEDWKSTGHGLPPRRDLQLEAIVEILRGKRWVHCHSYRQDEILAFLRLLEEYHVKVGSLQHILEGYKVAEVLAAHGATASSFSDWWAYKYEVFDAIPHNGALMHGRGIVVSFNSDDDELARHLNHEAAKAVKYGGVSPEEALKFVTLNPAKQLRIDAHVGSIEIGKHADLVLWSSSPLSTVSRCEQTWIDGRKYFDRQQDIARRQQSKELRTKLVQKILESGVSMLGPGEREENPAGEWARHDEFCHAKGHQHSQSGTHQHR